MTGIPTNGFRQVGLAAKRAVARSTVAGLALAVLFALAAGGSSPATDGAADRASSAKNDNPESARATGNDPEAAGDLEFQLEVGNRMYPEWSEQVEVGLGDRFYLGDTEYTAAANRVLPDFRIGEDGPFSVSQEWGNPALEMIVYRDTVAVDSSWAFRNFAPHFSPRSFFTFRILDISGPGAPAGETKAE